MKANEMPEKIYLFDYNDAMVTPIEGDTVYVREDAFIKKACDAYCEICDTKECEGCAECCWVIKFRRQLLKY